MISSRIAFGTLTPPTTILDKQHLRRFFKQTNALLHLWTKTKVKNNDFYTSTVVSNRKCPNNDIWSRPTSPVLIELRKNRTRKEETLNYWPTSKLVRKVLCIFA